MSMRQMTEEGGKKDSPSLPLLIRTNPFALKFALTKALHGNVLPHIPTTSYCLFCNAITSAKKKDKPS